VSEFAGLNVYREGLVLFVRITPQLSLKYLLQILKTIVCNELFYCKGA